jgi:hypothetical protein
MKTVPIKLLSAGFSQEEVDSATNLGGVASTASDVSIGVGELVGTIAMFSNFDPTGSMFSLTQTLKIFRRVRFIHVKFGIMLNAFLVALDPGFSMGSNTIKENYLF